MFTYKAWIVTYKFRKSVQSYLYIYLVLYFNTYLYRNKFVTITTNNFSKACQTIKHIIIYVKLVENNFKNTTSMDVIICTAEYGVGQSLYFIDIIYTIYMFK